MKKRLALLLSVAMAFSMFANVAFGAENTLTTAQKYDELVKAGVFSGFPGQTDPQLNTLTDRAQFSKILALVAGLDQVEGNSFKDQNYSKHWAKGYIEAVVKAGYMNGVGNSKFDLKGKVTGEQMAKSFALALGLKEVADAPAAEGVTKWATGWVAAIKAAGFDFSVNGKWNVPAPRSVLVEAAYDIKAKTGVKVESAVAIDEKTVEVTFSDKEKEKVTLDKALVEGQETTVSVTHKGKKYDVKVTLKALAVDAKVLGLTKVEAKLTRSVDTAKAKFEIKRGSTVLTNKDVKFSDDKLTAQIELSSKMREGEYTVTLSGVSEKPVTATFKVEEERVEKIELLSDKAAVSRDFDSVSVGFKVLNQYGDDISKTTPINWTASKGTVSVDGSMLTVKNVIGSTTVGKYILGEKLTITGIESTKYQKSLTTTVTVSEFAVVDKVEFKGLYNADKKELNTNSEFGDFYLLFEAYDQYGNKLGKSQLENAIIAYTSNPGIAGVEQSVANATYGQTPRIYDRVGANNDSLALRLAAPLSTQKMSGKVTVTVTGMYSAKTFTNEIEVAKASTVEKFTLLKPEKVVATGETVKIPYVAYDQFGKEVTAFKDLDGKISVQGPNITVKSDPITKKFVIEYKAPATETQYVAISSYIVSGGGNSVVTFDVKKAATPNQVVSVGDKVSLGIEGTQKLNKDNIKLEDQYGREMTLKKAIELNYKLVLKNNNPEYITASATEITTESGEIVLTGKAKGSASFELAIVKTDGTVVNNSAFSFNVSVVEKGAISEYVVEDIPTIADLTGTGVAQTVYANDYKVGLKVYGKTSGGGKVNIPASQYKVVTTNSNLKFVDGKLVADNVSFDSNKTEAKANIVVTIDGADNPTPVTKEVTISKAKPEAKEIKVGDKAGNVASIDGTAITTTAIANAGDLAAILKVKDQYGVERVYSADQFTAVVTQIPTGVTVDNNGGLANSVLINNAVVGKEFQVTFYALNSTTSITLKVVVVA